ncbi:ubiquinol-cytochrome c reductase iron-sulfur subunit [Halospina denitrificans]|uniref:Ubiquinol-cytochrome c reductase iron-sulfur subunit n=1 Tax=Halospina denitrificans TaxID=332522 RepID=A0A4R7JLB6_9GAMM|nr:ubiquinol-cytochrome c reductase iron-sulfur subunit [Halospina denitrificans]TDT37897.1 ubiquinol-cytochrome c reductase iron-sulfur subunit [Halospina denitrificans]
MNNGDVNHGRRRFLVGATSVIGGVGAVGLAVPFVSSWQPSAKAEAAGAPRRLSISKIEEGERVTVEWRGQPVWVVRRTQEMLDRLEGLGERLEDPNSKENQQPEYVSGTYRSVKPEFLVVVGICTHLGCSPSYRPEPGAEGLGDDWPGGFFCACHGSKFDLSGRVYTGVPAPTNLVVPPHRFEDDGETIAVGVDPEDAA